VIGGEAPRILNCFVRRESLPNHIMPGTDRMAVWVGLRVILECWRRNQILAPASNTTGFFAVATVSHMASATGD